MPTREPAEVICHGDIAPYNCVFRDGRPVAFIDFDTAHPGPRIWDLAWNTAFAQHIAAGHDRLYQADAAHIARNKVQLTNALR